MKVYDWWMTILCASIRSPLNTPTDLGRRATSSEWSGRQKSHLVSGYFFIFELLTYVEPRHVTWRLIMCPGGRQIRSSDTSRMEISSIFELLLRQKALSQLWDVTSVGMKARKEIEWCLHIHQAVATLLRKKTILQLREVEAGPDMMAKASMMKNEGPPRPDPPQHADIEASDEQEESEELAHDSEQFSLLQKNAQLRSTLTLSTMVAPPSFVKCDLTPVIQIRELLEELPWLMGPPEDLAIRGSTLEAVQPFLLPWQGETPLAYHLYTDGSYLKNFPDTGGCGIVLIISTNDEQLCGGVLSRTCLPTAKAHSAESIAMLWAALIATQLSANHRIKYPDTPFVLEFGFDANVTGQQCRGSWTSYKHPCIQRFTRNLVYVIQSRHGFDSIHWTHIKAHRGHWWNEVADVLAKHAVTHSDMVQNSELLYALLENEPSMRAIDWIWALEQMETAHPAMPMLMDNHLYHFRQPVTDIPPFENHFGATPNSKTQSQNQTKVTLTLKIATFNVLTLDSKKDKTIGTGTSGRHLTLLQQCHEHGLHMVGVQETRALRVTNKNNLHYHVIHSPCRSDGHCGIQIWLHRTLSFDGNGRPFRDEDYRIVWTTPNVLAIKMTHPSLHCIVIAARAYIRETYRRPPRVLAWDLNPCPP